MAPRTIVLSEPVGYKRELAKQLGADIICDPAKESLSAMVKEISGYGADVVLDHVGSSGTIFEGYRCLRKKGQADHLRLKFRRAGDSRSCTGHCQERADDKRRVPQSGYLFPRSGFIGLRSIFHGNACLRTNIRYQKLKKLSKRWRRRKR